MPQNPEILNLNNLDLPDLSWHDQAFCRTYTGKDANWNADSKAKSGQGGPIDKAIEYCNKFCPVKDICKDWILRIEATSAYAVDIYGGMTPLERRRNRLCPICFKGVLEVRGTDPVGPNGQMYNGKYCSTECEAVFTASRLKVQNDKRRSPTGSGSKGEFYKRGRIGA